MGEFKIRKALKDDASTISRLLLQLGYDTPAAKIEGLSETAGDNDELCVAVVDGEIAAVMSLIFFNYMPSAEKLCRITAIVVDEKQRGTGVGSKLIDHAKSLALAKKCNVLEVTTSLRREQTQAYYESIGFEKTSYKYVQRLKPL